MSKLPIVSQPIRSRGGCQTCKNRRKKCDETKPICLRCSKGGHVCLGYELGKVHNKPSPTRTSASTSTAPATIKPSLLGEKAASFFGCSLASSSGPAKSFVTPSPARQHDPRGQPHSWGNPTQLPYSILGKLIDSTGVPFSIPSVVPSSAPKTAKSQSDSLSFLSFLSGPSVFAPSEGNHDPSPPLSDSPPLPSTSKFTVADTPSDTTSSEEEQPSQIISVRPRAPSLTLTRLGKVVTNELWNNLLEVYSMFYTRTAFDWGRMRIDVANFTRTRANWSPVLRNAMFSLAALHQSFHEETARRKWRQRALEFNSNAHALIGNEIARTDISAKRKLASVIELLFFELGTRTPRAESSRRLLEQGKALIIEVLGSSHINIGSFRGIESLNYAIFGWIDIVTSMLLSQPTMLTYHFTDLSPDSFGVGADDCKIGLEALVHCPDEITICLFHISALREYALADLKRDGKLSESTLSSAKLIEDAIRRWQAAPSSIPLHEQPERLTVQECWRLTALVYLYQAVHHVGPLNTVLSDCVEQVIALSKAVPTTDINDLCLLLPCFFVGTATVKKKDRAYIRARIAKCKTAGIKEFIDVLDELWAKTDATGNPASWGEIIKSRPPTMLTFE